MNKYYHSNNILKTGECHEMTFCITIKGGTPYNINVSSVTQNHKAIVGHSAECCWQTVVQPGVEAN
jgi:VCBS repeat-containing protein